MQLTNNVKKIFLAFAQKYFRDVDSIYTWNPDPRVTKIFIADKYVTSPAIAEKMPSIILSRGACTYIQSSIDQMQAQSFPYAEAAKQRTDLVRGTITYNCTAQNGIAAEEIANTLYLNLVGFKDAFRQQGIHQILGISMGEEQIVRGDVVPRLFLVPVTVIFTVQTTIITSDDFYNCIIYLDGTLQAQMPDQYNFNVAPEMYGYTISGLTIFFDYPPPSGLGILVDYTGKYSLTNYTDVTPAGIVDGTNYIFTLPEDVYTPYTILSGITVYANIASGISN